jgi:hypothetical protein
MAAISGTQHLAFLKLVKEELSKAGTNVLPEQVKQEIFIRKQLNDMEQLRADYLFHLKSIHALIRRYEAIKKEARITLRKRMAACKKKAVKEQVKC